jgi:hypothetical protein
VLVDTSELFGAGLAKLFPEPQRQTMTHAIRLQVRLGHERCSVFGQNGERLFKVMRLYVSRRVGHVRIFFETTPERIVLWHISSSEG